MAVDPCSTCAFGPKRPGTAAAEPNNSVKGLICALGPLPFFCHHGRDGAEYDWKGSPLGVMQLAPENRKVCAGWKQAVHERARRGWFRSGRLIRRAVARVALDLLATFIDEETSPALKERAGWDLEECVLWLADKHQAGRPLPRCLASAA